MLASISAHDKKRKQIVEKKFRGKGKSKGTAIGAGKGGGGVKLKPEEKKELKELMTNASLINAHGRNAVIVLSARGVGPKTAGRILSKLQRDEYDLYREIMKAEVNFAKTSRFWT